MTDNIWHVFPINDEKEHILETEWKTLEYGTIDQNGIPKHNVEQRLLCPCDCCPAVKEQSNGAFIIVHGSFDGREGLEAVNEILNQ